MMLPNSRPPIDLPSPNAPLPAGQVTAKAGEAPNPPHVDYNHQPLLVSGLGHYVKPEADERFHVT
ncbi:MAG TPA: hypothetical protein VF738_03150 [Rhodanobacter sp.]